MPSPLMSKRKNNLWTLILLMGLVWTFDHMSKEEHERCEGRWLIQSAAWWIVEDLNKSGDPPLD